MTRPPQSAIVAMIANQRKRERPMTHYAIAHHADQPWRSPWVNVRWVFSGTGAENRAHAMCEASSEACLLIETDQPITTGRLPRGITGQRTYYEGAA